VCQRSAGHSTGPQAPPLPGQVGQVEAA
jgi:hypothetical protein